MKFGFESEKIIYDQKAKKVSNSALRTLESLDDYKVVHGHEEVSRVSGEFVHSMIEMNSNPADGVFEVARDYLFSYEMVREAAGRHNLKLLPVGAFPLFYQPVMVSKYQFYVQNAILTGTTEVGWNLEPKHGLFNASNCAGVHMHAEIDTLPEHLSFTRELMDKHNLAVSLVPFCAFASSPYFESNHEAMSMRSERYFFGVYKNLPFGGVPPIVTQSADLLRHFLESMRAWELRGVSLGFDADEIHHLAARGGANWGMVRWNRKWNTVEMRCFDTDLIGMDLGKFAFVSSVLRRTDLAGEGLQTRVLMADRKDWPTDPAALDAILASVLPEALELSGRELSILPTPLIHRLIHLAIRQALQNDLVYAYLGKALKLGAPGLDWREKKMADWLVRSYEERRSTAYRILEKTGHKRTINKADVDAYLEWLVEEEEKQLAEVATYLPSNFQPPKSGPFKAPVA